VAAKTLKLPGVIKQHNTKAKTKDGIDILKVTVMLDNIVGGEVVQTSATFALRVDQLENWPLDHAVEIIVGPSTK
jgi:hypothetical protein